MFGIVGTDEFDLHANNGHIVVGVGISMICISSAAVGLRLVSRRLASQPLLWDDWTIVMASPFAWAVCLSQILAVRLGGFGQHIQLTTPEKIQTFFQCLYADQLVYTMGITLVKISILLFYRRVFSISSTKLPAYIIGATVVAWCFSMMLGAIFSCIPVHAFWNRSIPSKCINLPHFYLGVAVPNIIHDVVLLIFPIPLIWNLHMPRSQKSGVMFIFALGGFIIVLSSLHIVTTAQPHDNLDVTWNYVALGIWNAVECNTAVALACLPSMLPIIRRILGFKARKVTRHLANVRPNRSYRCLWERNRGSTNSGLDELARFHGFPSIGRPTAVVRVRSNNDQVELLETETPPKIIVVKSDIEWVSEAK